MSSRVLRRLRQEEATDFSLLSSSTTTTTADSAIISNSNNTTTHADDQKDRHDGIPDEHDNDNKHDEDGEVEKDDDNDDEEDDDDDYEFVNRRRKEQSNLFMHVNMIDDDDSDDSDSSSSSSSSSSYRGTRIVRPPHGRPNKQMTQKQTKDDPHDKDKEEDANNSNSNNNYHNEEEEDNEEDIDLILSEFMTESNNPILSSPQDGRKNNNGISYGYNNLLRHPRDWMDYNVDDTILLIHNHHHHHGGGGMHSNNARRRSRRRIMKRNPHGGLFARRRDGWGSSTRPNNYLGGGLGMRCISCGMHPVGGEGWEDVVEGDEDWSVPWPYHGKKGDEGFVPIMYFFLGQPQHPPQPQQQPQPQQPQQRWYSFDRSSVYMDRMREYQNYIANTGDINAMAMFIADNPYIVEPLFHLAMFFFSLGENEKGMEVLKRILWILECACHGSLLYGVGNDGGGGGGGGDENENGAVSEMVVHLMDYKQEENEVFFRTLFWLSQTCCMIGCVVTSLALGKFLLSLDPLRDPMGILLVLDYYALASMRRRDDLFVVNLVDSGIIKIYYREDGDHETDGDGVVEICDLREMPNWAFSYALALYRRVYLYESDHNGEEIHDDDEDSNTTESAKWRKRAEEALDYAILRYPHMPRMLLEKNGVNLNARSFQCDWPSVIARLDSMDHPYYAGVNKIERIFVERGFKLWNEDHVQKWLYGGCQRVAAANTTNFQPFDRRSTLAALERYSNFDPMDFLGTFRRIPVDENPLDPRLLDAAMNYTPNRRRFLRINRRRGGRDDGEGIDMELLARQRPRTLLGTGRDGMQVIDPDLPLLELFWRSLLPWARVDGVSPRL